MRFADPQWLLLLPALVPWLILLRRRERHAPALRLGNSAVLDELPATPRARLAHRLPCLRLLCLALAIVALARPQIVDKEDTVRRRGIDLVVALDLSTSMLAEDEAGGEPRRNRLAVAKEVLAGFIDGRKDDRIGLVAFAARPYPAAPLTFDHAWLQAAVARLQTGMIEDGTAIGDAILAALNRLRGTAPGAAAGSQAIILLTDGRSNAGAATPQLAADAARALGIRIHAVGIGSAGRAVIPVVDPLGRTLRREVKAELDEAGLREIAASTGGRYFRADDRSGLVRVFEAIDRLEKRPLEEKVYLSWRDLFPHLLLAALALLVAECALRATLLRTVP